MELNTLKKYYLVDSSLDEGFPPEDTFTEVQKPSYGLKVAKAIEREWFGGGGNNLYNTRREGFNELRKYAIGNQPTKKYTDILCLEGSMEWQSIDWRPLSIAPKIIDEIVNGIHERLYGLKVEAIDTEATNQRKEVRDRIETDMMAKPFLKDMKDLLGIDAFSMPEDMIPTSEEELDVYMTDEFALPIEIATEKVIKMILEYNDIDVLSKRVIRDIVEIGVGGLMRFVDPVSGIQLKYVDPAFHIHSYTTDPDFKNVFYHGMVEQLPISEVKRMFIDESIDWKAVKKDCISFNNYMGMNTNPNIGLDNFTVNVLYFDYQTSKNIVYKKKIMKGGAFKMIRRDNNYNPPNSDSSRQARVDSSIETWMKGAIILGTDILLSWEEASNITRSKGLLHKPMSNFSMFSVRQHDDIYDSLLRRMISGIDQVHLAHYKIQHLVSKVNPDGVHFNADALQGIDLGDGNSYTPKDALRLYLETGSTFGRDTDESNNRINNKVVTPNYTSGQSDKIKNIMGTMAFYMSMIMDAVGANQQSTNPDPDALVGVQQLAALNANLATRHIRDSILSIMKSTAIGISLNLKDAWKYADFKQFLINGIGRVDSETLKALDKMNLHDLGLFVYLRPDAKEQAEVLESINEALRNQQISITDRIDILAKDNFKEQSQLLKIRIKKSEEIRKQEEEAKIKMNEESQINISNASSQSKAEVEQMKHQFKMEQLQMQSQMKREDAQMEADVKARLLEQEHQYNMELKKVSEDKKGLSDYFKEKIKDKREADKATRQSQLSYQRKNNLPPQRFSEEDEEDEVL